MIRLYRWLLTKTILFVSLSANWKVQSFPSTRNDTSTLVIHGLVSTFRVLKPALLWEQSFVHSLWNHTLAAPSKSTFSSFERGASFRDISSGSAWERLTGNKNAVLKPTKTSHNVGFFIPSSSSVRFLVQVDDTLVRALLWNTAQHARKHIVYSTFSNHLLPPRSTPPHIPPAKLHVPREARL